MPVQVILQKKQICSVLKWIEYRHTKTENVNIQFQPKSQELSNLQKNIANKSIESKLNSYLELSRAKFAFRNNLPHVIIVYILALFSYKLHPLLSL